MKKQLFLYLIVVMCFVCCQQEEVETPKIAKKTEQKIPISLDCDSSIFYDMKKPVGYNLCVYYKNKGMRYSFDPSFYPLLGRINNDGKRKYQAHKIVNYGFKIPCLSKNEMTDALKISVDDSQLIGFKLYDNSDFVNTACLNSILVTVENQGNKAFLLDQFDRVRFILERKNKYGKWEAVHDINRVGCGLENGIGRRTKMNLIQPDETIFTQIPVAKDTKLHTYRLKYNLHNQVDSTQVRASKTTWKYQTSFVFREVEPIYSNTFSARLFVDFWH